MTLPHPAALRERAADPSDGEPHHLRVDAPYPRRSFGGDRGVERHARANRSDPLRSRARSAAAGAACALVCGAPARRSRALAPPRPAGRRGDLPAPAGDLGALRLRARAHAAAWPRERHHRRASAKLMGRSGRHGRRHARHLDAELLARPPDDPRCSPSISTGCRRAATSPSATILSAGCALRPCRRSRSPCCRRACSRASRARRCSRCSARIISAPRAPRACRATSSCSSMRLPTP